VRAHIDAAAPSHKRRCFWQAVIISKSNLHDFSSIGTNADELRILRTFLRKAREKSFLCFSLLLLPLRAMGSPTHSLLLFLRIFLRDFAPFEGLC
jgi:hypothetical protein